MLKNFRESFREVKVGFISVYPSISDVLDVLSRRCIPWFNLIYEDGRKKSVAIVDIYDATNISRYKNFLEKIEDIESLREHENPKIVFRAILPAIMVWVEENNYISCARTLSSLFIQISEDDSPPLSKLIDDISWQIKEEYKKSTRNNTRTALLVALKNLENIGG